MKRLILTLLVLVMLGNVGEVDAQGRRWRRQPVYYPPTVWVQPPQVIYAPQTTTASECSDALTEVNNYRATKGKPPFVHDPLLTQAAYACAKQRAARLIGGHLPESDFAYLPQGGNAAAAGCATWEPSWGWGSCCMDDLYTYGGAAWVLGRDGKRYMHLFVR